MKILTIGLAVLALGCSQRHEASVRADSGSPSSDSSVPDAQAADGGEFDASSSADAGVFDGGQADTSIVDSGRARDAACLPITEDGSGRGADCTRDDQCLPGYVCQGFSGIVFTQSCQIPCEEDCDCPDGLSCEPFTDKAGTWTSCR